MDSPVPVTPSGGALAPGHPCPGCGASLAPRVYFCVVCSRPWRDVEDVLPPARPAPPTVGELIRKKAPDVWPLFWTYAIVIVAGTLLSILIAGVEFASTAVVVVDVLLLVVTVFASAKYGATLRPALVRSGFENRFGWLAVLSVVPLLVLNFAYYALLREATGLRDETSVLSDAGFSPAALVFLFAVFPAITEEIAFRGLLLPWLHAAVGERRALVISSALFSALHGNLLAAPYLFVAGLALGLARTRSRSLYPPILLHFLHNWGVLAWLGGPGV